MKHKLLTKLTKMLICIVAAWTILGYSYTANASSHKTEANKAEPVNSNNRYRVGGIIGTALLIKGSQQIFPKLGEPQQRSGSSFTFDWFGGNARQHSLALDFHTLGRGNSRTIRGVKTTESSMDVRSLYLGYRYHTPSGFYVGVGAVPINSISSGTITFFYDHDNARDIGVNVKSSPSPTVQGTPIGINLGYVHTYKSGFSVGFNALQTNAVDLKNPDGIVENGGFQISTIGVVLAYTKRK